MVPAWHNADSIGYNPEDTGRPIESWAELFSEDFKGRVALLNVPQIGTMDAALGIEAMGLYQFKDKGQHFGFVPRHKAMDSPNTC